MSEPGKDIIEGPANAVAHPDGTKPAGRVTMVMVKIPKEIDVRAIRRKLGLTQEEFAARFGFSVKNIHNWEQYIRQPGGSARAYLFVIDREPEAVERALRAG